MNSAPQNEQLLLLPSYWSLPKMNSAPQNEQLLFLPSYCAPLKTSAPQNKHLKKKLLENGNFNIIIYGQPDRKLSVFYASPKNFLK